MGTRLAAVAAMILVLGGVAPATAAGFTDRVNVVGATSQGTRVRIQVATLGHHRGIRAFDANGIVSCTRSGYSWTMGMGIAWSGGIPRQLQGPTFDYSDNWDDSSRFHLTGTWQEDGSVSGTLLIAWARVTEDDQAEACTTGVLTYTASPKAGLDDLGEPPEMRVQTTIDASGLRTRAVDGLGVSPSLPTDRLPSRLFRGVTSAGDRLSFDLIRRTNGKSVSLVDMGFVMACPSGVEYAYGLGGYWVARLDESRSFETIDWSDVKIRWSGTVLPATASGVLSSVGARFLTGSDTEVEACVTGPLTWQAARVPRS